MTIFDDHDTKILRLVNNLMLINKTESLTFA